MDELMSNSNIKLDKYYLLSIGNTSTLTNNGIEKKKRPFYFRLN